MYEQVILNKSHDKHHVSRVIISPCFPKLWPTPRIASKSQQANVSPFKIKIKYIFFQRFNYVNFMSIFVFFLFFCFWRKQSMAQEETNISNQNNIRRNTTGRVTLWHQMKSKCRVTVIIIIIIKGKRWGKFSWPQLGGTEVTLMLGKRWG